MVGALKTPVAELWDDDQPDEESDAPEQYVTTIFGEQVPASLLQTGVFRGRRLERSDASADACDIGAVISPIRQNCLSISNKVYAAATRDWKCQYG